MVMARGHHARNDDAKLLQNLLEACGQCIEVPESYVDIHTGLSGSGVAFVSMSSPYPQRPCSQGLRVKPWGLKWSISHQ